MSKSQSINPADFVREHTGWVLVLTERILKDRGLAEDAVQEAFIAAFNNIDQFETRPTLKTGLHRITVNVSLSRLRQIKRRAEQSIDDLLPEFDSYDCRIEKPWTYLTPLEEVLESDNLRAQVESCIDDLPDSYRIVLLLRDIEGFDAVEVAE